MKTAPVVAPFFLAVLALLCIPHFPSAAAAARPYNAEWKAVEAALQKGLPKTALENIQLIVDASLAAGDYDTAARAIARKITIQAQIEGSRPEEKIIRIDAELATAPPEMKPVLSTLRAWWIWQYYQQNRFRFMQRTTTAEAPGDDFKAWDLPRILKEIRASFDAALAESDALKRIPVASFSEFLQIGGLPAAYRPTLFDVIANEALTFFSSAEQAGAQPQDAFVLQANSPILDPAEAFLTWKPESTDATSLDFRAIQIYQDLLRFHRDDADRTAFLDADLSRITWGMNAAAGQTARERGRAALERFARENPGHELSALALHALAATYLEEDPAKARALARQGADGFPESPFGILCWNLIQSIESPTLSVQSERVWNAAGPEFTLRYKNLTEVHFRLVGKDWDSVAQDRRYWNPDRPDQRRVESLINSKPDYAWKVDLPATDDYRERTVDLSPPDQLKPGYYFLIASARKSFAEPDNQVSVTAVWVSDLALVVRPNENRIEGFLLDALSGEPIAGGNIQEWHHTNQGEREAGLKTSTDENGFFAFAPKESSNSCFIKATANISGKTQSVTSMDAVSPQWRDRQKENPLHVFFFTDRTLYRPGQAIQYKGISLRADKDANTYATLPNEKVSVRFDDPNGKEIATVEHTTNDRGSFSGTFTAPRDRLAGVMTIRTLGAPNGSTQISVEEYKRPKFHTEIAAPAEPARLEQPVTVKGTASTYADAPVDGAKVSWRVTREVEWPIWCRFFFPPQGADQEIAHGTAMAAADGTYEITFTASPDPDADPKNEPVFTYAIRADVTDSAGETRSAERFVKVGYTALRAALTAEEWQTPAKQVIISIGVTSLDGEPRDSAGTVKIHALNQPDRVHRPGLQPSYLPYARFGRGRSMPPAGEGKTDLSNPEYWELGNVVKELAFETKEGKAKLAVLLPAGIYRALVETRDAAGKSVTSRLTIRVLDPASDRLAIKLPNLLTAESWNLQPGKELHALWGTGYDAGRAFVEISHQGKALKRFWTAKDATQQFIELPITEELRGGFTLQITRVQENRAYLEARQVSVPWSNKKLSLKWEHFTSKLLPGAKETWTAVVTGPDAEATAAEVVATLYDASLDQFKPWSWMDAFPVFRAELYRNAGAFQNTFRGLDHVKGGFRTESKGASTSRTQFPSDLTQSYSGFGRRRGMAMYGVAGVSIPMTPTTGEDLSMLREEQADGMAFLGGSDAAPMAAAAPMMAKEQRMDMDKPGAPPAGAPPIDATKIAARKNLNESAFFFPQLTSDGAGTIRMEFTVPEALTTWRFLGFAHDTALRAGLLEGEMVTSKDLMVQPNPPRFLREGDTVEFTVKVTNRSDIAQSGKAQLNFNDSESGESMDAALGISNVSQPFEIPAKESGTLSWRITVPDGCGFLTYKAVAATDTISDGEEGWLPVLSRRILVTESLPLPIRGPGTKEFTFQKLIDSGKSDTLRSQNLVVQMVSNPSWYAVMALPYLMEFPHECNEQTFNRLYANTLGRHIAGSDPVIHKVFEQWRNTPALDSPLEKNQDLKSLLIEETPWYRDAKDESQARRNVGILFEDDSMNAEFERTFAKLGEAQYPDGAWPWFPGGQGDDFITLYITCGFARLRHLGVDVNIELALNALNRLDRWIDEEYNDLRRENKHWKEHVPTATEAFYLYTRSFFLKDRGIPDGSKAAVDFYLGQSRKYWLETANRMTQGHLALALNRFGEKETPAAIMASLKERSVSSEEMGMFWKDSDPSWWWNRAPIETQALLIEAFDEVAGDLVAVEDCRVWLLKQKQTQNWKTTKATSDAIYALLLRGKDILKRTDLVEVTLGGISVTPSGKIPTDKPNDKVIDNKDEPAVEAGTGSYEKRFGPGEIRPEMGRITVTKKDEGVAWGGVHWQYLEDMAKVTPHEGTPLKLKKQIFTRVNTPQGPTLKPVVGPVAPGDEVIVRVELRVDRAMEYIHLKDQRGSGTEPVNVLSGRRMQDGLSYYESTRDTASHFFIEYLPEGTYVFEYPVRVQLRGKYQTGIAEVQCMYAPEFNSHSASVMMEVR